MKNFSHRAFVWLNRRFGYEIWNYKGGDFPPDFDDPVIEVIRNVAPYTSTSKERVYALHNAVEYVSRHGIPGAIVECGVWRGGSMMAAASTLLRLGDTDRDLYLCDTFAGMPEPGAEDLSWRDEPAVKTWRALHRGNHTAWCYAPVEEVRGNMQKVGYPLERIHYVVGLVEQTIPAEAPEQIALLRLDTDWYASVRHGLEHLFPRLSPGGILIVDDYGHWQGARKATDEYLRENGIRMLLNRIDYTARLGVKP